MDSHIQFPKAILKHFADENKTLYYYDFREDRIKRGRAKSFNTESGYYSEDSELFFSANIETEIGKVIKQIEDDNFYDELPDKNIADNSRNYIYSLISRNPEMIDETKRHSVFLQFMPERDIRDYVAVETLVLAHNADLLGRFPFAIGTTEESFVLNSRGMIQFDNMLCCPLTTKRAAIIPLFKHQDFENCIPVFDLTAETERINTLSFRYEKNDFKRFVIANNSEQLKCLERLSDNTAHRG